MRSAFCTVFPFGLLWVIPSGANRSVQDVVLRTSVIYDWVISIPGFRKAAPVGAGSVRGTVTQHDDWRNHAHDEDDRRFPRGRGRARDPGRLLGRSGGDGDVRDRRGIGGRRARPRAAARPEMQALCAQMVAEGLSPEAATALATENGYVARVGMLEGEPQAVTMDLREDRFTFEVTGGVVVACTYG